MRDDRSGRGPRRGPSGPNGPFRSGRTPDRSGPRHALRRQVRPRGLAIIHEDHDVLVVDKPPGLVTAAVPGQETVNLFGLVKDHVRAGRKFAKAWIIHRLDREASGLLVFAKSERAFLSLKDQFKSRKAHRLYIATVEGEFDATPGGPGRVPQAPSGTIQSILFEDRDGKVHSIPENEYRPRGGGQDEGQLAITHYRVIASGQGRSVAQVRLKTGRKHQIRVHMAQIGHPVSGDLVYGKGANPISRLALHATELGFDHPATGESVRFVSPPPASFYRLAGTEPPKHLDTDHPAPPNRPERAPDRGPQGSWDHVAEWYDDLLEDRGSDHHSEVIFPGVLRLLGDVAGRRILDVACGQGALAKELADRGATIVGVDASPRLIEAAGARSLPSARFVVGDARDLSAALPVERAFDAATCVMALMNIDPFPPVLTGISGLIKPGGSVVMVILHPAFRCPGRTSWGWTRPRPPGAAQFRRVDAYLSDHAARITMNPGAASQGEAEVITQTHHRPIEAYVRALAGAGLVINAMEEWASNRVSQPGPRAPEENRARREIPMFLAIRAVRMAGPGTSAG